MARRAFPRPTKSHEITAAEILRRHAARTGQSVTLPVPIEMIIERTYHLEVRYEPIDEPPGMMILGALAPRERRIVINAAHERLLGDVNTCPVHEGVIS
ncbi:MAG: hypothetical protein HKP18_11430 [Acidimicrobiia bacterium]|nr:hypothetical protein [Acidimicrobiia bacterium]